MVVEHCGGAKEDKKEGQCLSECNFDGVVECVLLRGKRVLFVAVREKKKRQRERERGRERG